MTPGHDPGHESAPPIGFTWDGYLERLVSAAGGRTALADELARRARGADELPADLATIERGLRRLAGRGNRPGGQYGRWLLRHFGVPEDVESWARWLAQYHSRFADMPARLRLEQLRLWDRPPFIESRLAAWIHLGLASVHLRMRAVDLARQRLAMAERGVERAGAAAVIEAALLVAYMATNRGEREPAERALDRAGDLLARGDGIGGADAACLGARLLGQRAYHRTRPEGDARPALLGARARVERIADDPAIPFVCFRRESGLAYCAWQLGDVETGIELAQRAADHAGDGGLVRFRVMALALLARMLPEPRASAVRERAERLAHLIDDDDLVARVRPRPPTPPGRTVSDNS